MKTRPMMFATSTRAPFLAMKRPEPFRACRRDSWRGAGNCRSGLQKPTASFWSQTWFAGVTTSAPASIVSTWICSVMPKPPAAFSAVDDDEIELVVRNQARQALPDGRAARLAHHVTPEKASHLKSSSQKA